MNLSDALAHYGWQVTAWIAVGCLSIIAAFAVGLAIGRRMGRLETPHVYKRALDRMALSVVRWRERWRAERDRREMVEEREANLRGAQKAYDDALRRTA